VGIEQVPWPEAGPGLLPQGSGCGGDPWVGLKSYWPKILWEGFLPMSEDEPPPDYHFTGEDFPEYIRYLAHQPDDYVQNLPELPDVVSPDFHHRTITAIKGYFATAEACLSKAQFSDGQERDEWMQHYRVATARYLFLFQNHCKGGMKMFEIKFPR
jgi:hypothetical protein